jgi:hypothetical protein
MNKRLIITICLVMTAGVLLGAAQDAMAGGEIIGAPKCKMCHGKKTGDQWTKWTESAHAGAFMTLASDEAKAIATEKGLGDPQTEAACLKCHTTHGFLGSEVAVYAKGKYEDAEGVGCESCHGAGSEYKSKKVMQDQEASIAAGMVVPDEKTCTKCHNSESPTFKEFDFAAMYAKIKHEIPAAE